MLVLSQFPTLGHRSVSFRAQGFLTIRLRFSVESGIPFRHRTYPKGPKDPTLGTRVLDGIVM